MKTTIGIDVSSATLQACLLRDGDSSQLQRSFENSKKGVRKLTHWVKTFSPCTVVMEATGGYEKAAKEHLMKSDIIPYVANPNQIRHFAQGMGKQVKTDRIDAYVIASFARVVQLKTPVKSSETEIQLKELITRRLELLGMRTAEQNRLRTAGKIVKKSIRKTLKVFEKELERLEDEIIELSRSDGEIERKKELLCTQSGVGQITALTMIALVPELGQVNRKEIASICGVAPMTRESGNWKGRSFVCGGRAMARKALYMPALVAITHDKELAEFYNRLVEKGKPKKVALVAVMRKLLVKLNHLLKYHFYS